MQDSTSQTHLVLDYAIPSIPEKPRRWWVLLTIGGMLVAWEEFFCPRSTPPGWPMSEDYFGMIFVPIGAIVMATTTSLPGWIIGAFGAASVLAFVPGQLGDGRLKFRLYDQAAVNSLILQWCAAAILSWSVCRMSVLVRRKREPRFPLVSAEPRSQSEI